MARLLSAARLDGVAQVCRQFLVELVAYTLGWGEGQVLTPAHGGLPGAGRQRSMQSLRHH
jgi:hypothetical protein